MEVLQARLNSYVKSKRTKSSKSATIKWPHPSTYKANPRTLAEAGFYFNPSSDDKDSVTCFMCGKELSAWDEDDDPFSVHWTKCRGSCAWAMVRCGIVADVGEDGSYDFSDPARQPGGKALEKARLETFTMNKSWPHDSIKGHGASSKKMAKAGFVYTPQSVGDDTATCVYCNLSLSGWVEGDDPTEEHLKREKKSGVPCAFFQQPAARALGRSTSKPPSRAASKSRTVSQTRSKATEVVEPPSTESEDELASAPAPTLANSTRGSQSMSTRASAATPAAKTPASRRSTRTGTSGKTPGRRAAAGSEVEDTEGGSGSDAGKRVSKTKRKAPGKARGQITIIEEEEEDVPPADLEEQVEVEAEVVVEKPKRGRPQKGAGKAKAKKPEVVEMDSTAEESDAEPAPVKKMHARTRSRANVETESDAPVPSSSKPTHSRTRSASKGAPSLQDSAAGVGKGSRKKTRMDDDTELLRDKPLPPSLAAKNNATKVSRSKAKKVVTSDDEGVVSLGEQRKQSESVKEEAKTVDPSPPILPAAKKKGKQRERTPSVSDAAEYATPEPPVDPEPMEVDDDLPPIAAPDFSLPKSKPKPEELQFSPRAQVQPAEVVKTRSVVNTDVGPDIQPSSKSESQQVPRPTRKVTRTGTASLSRTSSATDASYRSARMSRDKLKVVEIPSDDEGEKAPAPARQLAKTSKTVESQQLSTQPVAPKDASKGNRKDAVAEVILPSKLPDAADEVMPDSKDFSITEAAQEVEESPVVLVNGHDIAISGPSTPPRSSHHLPPIPQNASMPPPSRDDEERLDQDDVDTSLTPFVPFMSLHPIEVIMSLTDEERAMTVEQYLRSELERQYQQFKEDGERRFAELRERAAEAKRMIEAA